MSDIGKSALKNLIDTAVVENETGAITGTVMNGVLQDTVDTLANGENLDAGSIKTANIADGAITTAKVANGAITEGKIGSGAVTSGKIGDGAVTAAKIGSKAVETAKLDDAAVTTAKIADGAVTADKVGAGAVTAGKIGAKAVTTAKLDDKAVTTAKVDDSAITTDKIANGNVTTAKINDGAVSADKIGSSAVTEAKIADGAVTSDKIAAGGITSAKINDGAVTTAKIADGAVSSDKLGAGAVTTTKIYDGNVTGAKIADSTITGAKIASNTIETGNIKAKAVTTAKIDDAAVDTAQIKDSAVTTDKLATSAVTTVKVNDGAVTTGKIADAGVTTAKIADANVTTDKIADSNVTAAKIAANAVETAKIKDGNVTTAKLDDEAVTTAKIADEAITTAKVADGAITDDKLANPISVSQDAEAGTTTITVGEDSYDVATEPVSVSQDASTGKTTITVGSDSYDVATEPVSVSQNTITIGGNYAGEVSTTYDVTLHNSGATFASLEALLSDADLATLIPTDVRKGGMSIKFVQTSDNKYVQWRLAAADWSINVADWKKELEAFSVAPLFVASNSSSYSVGDVCMHDGIRYRCIQNHLPYQWLSQYWTEESVQEAVDNNKENSNKQINLLKSVVNSYNKQYCLINRDTAFQLGKGYNNAGNLVDIAYSRYYEKIDISNYIGEKLYIKAAAVGGISGPYCVLFDANDNVLQAFQTDSTTYEANIIIPNEAKWLGVSYYSHILSEANNLAIITPVVNDYTKSIESIENEINHEQCEYSLGKLNTNGDEYYYTTIFSLPISRDFNVFINAVEFVPAESKENVYLYALKNGKVINKVLLGNVLKGVKIKFNEFGGLFVERGSYWGINCKLNYESSFNYIGTQTITYNNDTYTLGDIGTSYFCKANCEYKVLSDDVVILPLNVTNGKYYNSQLEEASDIAYSWLQKIDVSDYNGCLAKIEAYAPTGGGAYCGFLDEDNNVISTFRFGFGEENFTINAIVPIPRQCVIENTTYKGAKYMCISSYTETIDTFRRKPKGNISILKRYNIPSLVNKNICIVGTSLADMYYENSFRFNYGYYLYHLAPMFGYNIYNYAIGGSNWESVSTQYSDALNALANDFPLRPHFDIVICENSGLNDGFGSYTADYDKVVAAAIAEINEQGTAVDVSQHTLDAITACINIINGSPRCRLFITNHAARGNGSLTTFNLQTAYRYNVAQALCDVFNAKLLDFGNGTSWRVWKETGSSKAFSPDGLHSSTVLGGYEDFRFVIGQLINNSFGDNLLGYYNK